MVTKWSNSEEILDRFSMNGLPTIHDHVANIVGALKGTI
eukprot:CAMPEP_0182432604 /NCGR_PEP_ID=MMETSP1167-20130531/57713_1 /TAXON_ID=2988 /ORGANISM="Mallomonas Sp, Strain CCMP3275" /LENGTH=38 /DNA_ID= /DNA_START= /DNA_END= /DNA_ORIENTATION=